jgi:hypothetical protein
MLWSFFFRNAKKYDYPVNRICYYIARCLTFETVLFFLQRNILDKCALQLGWWHNQCIACLTSAIPALSNRYENHGFFKYEIQKSHVMAGVGTREFSPKCYVCDTDLHLQPFIGNGDLHYNWNISSTGWWTHNQWLNEVFNIHIPIGTNTSLYKLKGKAFRMIS